MREGGRVGGEWEGSGREEGVGRERERKGRGSGRGEGEWGEKERAAVERVAEKEASVTSLAKP